MLDRKEHTQTVQQKLNIALEWQKKHYSWHSLGNQVQSQRDFEQSAGGGNVYIDLRLWSFLATVMIIVTPCVYPDCKDVSTGWLRHPVKRLYNKSHRTDEKFRCSSWAWKIEHVKPNVRGYTVMHLRDRSAALGNRIAFEKRLLFRNNMKKTKTYCNAFLLLSFITGSKRYPLLRFPDHTLFRRSLKSKPTGSAILFSVVSESCRFSPHPVAMLGTLVLERQAASNNQRKGITKQNHPMCRRLCSKYEHKKIKARSHVGQLEDSIAH